MRIILPSSVSHKHNKLNEEELREFNLRIVAKLRILRRCRKLKSLAKVSTSDRVYFIHQGRKIVGTIIRFNQESASIHFDEGGHWTVAQEVLALIADK